MIDKVKVVYGLAVVDNCLDGFVNRVLNIAHEYHCDCVLHIQRNHIEINFMSFSYKGAHQISDCEGAEILQSIVDLFDTTFKEPLLWDAELISKLPL